MTLMTLGHQQGDTQGTTDAQLSLLLPSPCRLARGTRDFTWACCFLCPLLSGYQLSSPLTNGLLLPISTGHENHTFTMYNRYTEVARGSPGRKVKDPVQGLVPPLLECSCERRDGQVAVLQTGQHHCMENNRPFKAGQGEAKTDPGDPAL